MENKTRQENQFDISLGNLKVLETIPKMMKNEKWRNELRKLVLAYLYSGEENGTNKRSNKSKITR